MRSSSVLLPTVLPTLRGVWLALFRMIWCLAFALTVFSAIGATWLDASPSRESTWRSLVEREGAIGVTLLFPVAARTWCIGRVTSPAASASGVHTGECLVALNGHPVTPTTPAAAIAQAMGHREGEITVLRLVGAGGRVQEHALAYRQANIDAWYRGSGLNPFRQYLLRRVAYDLMTLLMLAVSTVLFLRRSHEPVAAAFAIGLCLMPIGRTVEFWGAIDAFRSYQVLSAVPYFLMLMTGCAFPDGRYWPSWTRFSLIAVLGFIPAVFSASEDAEFTLFTAPAFIAIVVMLALRYRRLTPGAERQQLRWAAFGIAAGIILQLLRIPFVFLQDALGQGSFTPWIDLAGSFLHALGFAVIGAGFGVALLRYRLYDAESFIGRSAVLAAVTLLIAGLWAGLEQTIGTFLPSALGQGQQALASALSAAFAVVVASAAHRRMHAWIEKRFQKGVYLLKAKLPALLDALAPRWGTAELCGRVLNDVVRDVRATKAALLLRQEDGRLFAMASRGVEEDELRVWIEISTAAPRAIEDDVVESETAPFRLALPLIDNLVDENVGWLLVGARPDGTSCNRDERRALAEVAAPIARAIATTLARDRREARLWERLEALVTGSDVRRALKSQE